MVLVFTFMSSIPLKCGIYIYICVRWRFSLKRSRRLIDRRPEETYRRTYSCDDISENFQFSYFSRIGFTLCFFIYLVVFKLKTLQSIPIMWFSGICIILRMYGKTTVEAKVELFSFSFISNDDGGMWNECELLSCK